MDKQDKKKSAFDVSCVPRLRDATRDASGVTRASPCDGAGAVTPLLDGAANAVGAGDVAVPNAGVVEDTAAAPNAGVVVDDAVPNAGAVDAVANAAVFATPPLDDAVGKVEKSPPPPAEGPVVVDVTSPGAVGRGFPGEIKREVWRRGTNTHTHTHTHTHTRSTTQDRTGQIMVCFQFSERYEETCEPFTVTVQLRNPLRSVVILPTLSPGCPTLPVISDTLCGAETHRTAPQGARRASRRRRKWASSLLPVSLPLRR